MIDGWRGNSLVRARPVEEALQCFVEGWGLFCSTFCGESAKLRRKGRVADLATIGHPPIVRLGEIISPNFFRLRTIVAAAFFWAQSSSNGAEPPGKPDSPPPVSQGDAKEPAAGEKKPESKTPGKADEAQALPENLPPLVEPVRPPLIPRQKPVAKVPVFEPLPEEVPAVEVTPAESELSALEKESAVPDVATFSLQDPVARTSLYNAFGNAETFYDGFGGIPQPLTVPILPRAEAEGVPRFRMGPLVVRPTFSASFLSNHGRGNASELSNQAVIALRLGGLIGELESNRYLGFDYSIARSFESKKQDNNPFSQSFFLAGHLQIGRLQLGAGIDFAALSGYSRDAGAQTRRDLLTVALTSTYELTSKLSFDWDISMPNGRSPGGNTATELAGDSSGFTSTNFLNYEYSPKTKLGLGFAAGYLEVKDADRQTFEQVLVRVASIPTPFFNFSTSVGMEYRDTGHKTMTTPIFILGAAWTPRERTRISLAAEQRVQSSGETTAENFVSTSAILSLSQRLGDRFDVSLTLGFERAKYESIGIASPVGQERRDERTYFAQAATSMRVTDRLGVSATYSFAKTESNVSPAQNSQIAFQASYSF